MERAVLNDINRRILEEVQEDARVSLAELGRRINLSPAAVAERLARLEQAGVITGYRAEINPKAVGYAVTAVVRVRPGMGQLPKIPDIARQTPEVTECYRVTGEDCFLMTLHLRQIDELEAILDRFAPYGQTTTSIVHSAPVPPRALPLRE
ncbi:MAG: Lrp/AsnC family transcriptional regulator [Solirubrobacterales bacterium]|nr:Lrp/AsnC family transcriptional regulator [Solirubrobacterales bacterium]MBV9714050.1 Lrp/AsnC family transcriptional regulator [Solirubrobacterales bacterium]